MLPFLLPPFFPATDLLGYPMTVQHSGDLWPFLPHSVHLGTGTPASPAALVGGGGGLAALLPLLFFELLPLFPLCLEPLWPFLELLTAANQSEALTLSLPWSCLEPSSSMALLGAWLPAVLLAMTQSMVSALTRLGFVLVDDVTVSCHSPRKNEVKRTQPLHRVADLCKSRAAEPVGPDSRSSKNPIRGAPRSNLVHFVT